MRVIAVLMALLFTMQPALEVGKAYIHTREKSIELSVELALTPDQRSTGLMYRESLPENSGMIFLYDPWTFGSFWMKNTLIPLSIAFFDPDGRIIYITDMEPETTEPHGPGKLFKAALEVNKGWFERNKVSVGDRIEIFKEGKKIFP